MVRLLHLMEFQKQSFMRRLLASLTTNVSIIALTDCSEKYMSMLDKEDEEGVVEDNFERF